MTQPDSNSQSPKARKQNRLIIRLFIAFVIVGMAVGAWLYFAPEIFSGKSNKKPIYAVVIKGELKVSVGDRGELDSVEAVQVVNDLEGGGKLVSIIDEGKRVKKGDICAQIDTDQFVKAAAEQDVKLQTADGKVKTSRSAVAQAKTKADSELNKAELAWKLAVIDLEAYDDPKGEYMKDLDKAKGVLELNRKQLKEAEDELTFTRDMVRDGHIPLPQLRPREQSVEQRKFEVRAAEAELTLLERFTRKKKITELQAKSKDTKLEFDRTKEIQASLIESAVADFKAAESNFDIEKKQLERIKQQMDRCTIKAPSDGIVVYSNSRWYDESSRIRPGATLYYRQEIFTLPDLSKMKAKLKIHESVIKKVKMDMDVTIVLESLPDRPLHGKVIKIGTIAQGDNWRGGGIKQYDVEVSIVDLPSDAGLKPGMTGQVTILVGTIAEAISVPVAAVTEYEDKKVVYVIEGTKITRKNVTVGESNEQFIQILEGLEPGQEVALDARTRASNDLKESVKNDPSKEKK